MAREKMRFLVDENGRKESVVISIADYQELLEDLADLAAIAERKEEPVELLELVKRRLQDKARDTSSSR